MKQWERIPRNRLIQVSERKWMRLRSLVDWKVIKQMNDLRKQLYEVEQEKGRLSYDLNRQAVLAMETNIAWMDKCNALKAELAALKQSALELV